MTKKEYDRFFPTVEEREKYESMKQLLFWYIDLMDAVDEVSREYNMPYEAA